MHVQVKDHEPWLNPQALDGSEYVSNTICTNISVYMQVF